MMVLTAKVNIKKIVIILAIVAAVILAMILLLGGNDNATPTAATVSDNDSRVEFLESFGWDVSASPTESGQVRIPSESSDLFTRYNLLQKSQGYDLSQFAGKKVMRYVYKVNNFPGATEPVYATVLVYKNQIIGGDITDTAAKGKLQGFQIQGGTSSEEVTETTADTAAVE